MSDLLIRGIGMPTEKPIAVVIHPDGTAYCAEMLAGVCTEYLNDCVAIPVPPHGRLIDADALIADIRANSESYFADDFAHEWVDVAPTVIPAEEGE